MLAMKSLFFVVLALAHDPSSAESSLFEKAEIARKENRESDALELFRQALAAQPDDVEAHLGYQKLLQSLGKETRLVDEYSRLLRERDEPWCHFLLGRVLHDPAREEELYRKGLEKNPDSFRLRLALASALRRQRRYEEAKTEYLAAQRLEPVSMRAHTGFMNLLRQMGEESSLPKIYAEGARDAATDHFPFLLHGIALAISGDLTGSLEQMQRAQKLAPDDIEVLLALATLHFKQGATDAAHRYFETVMEKDRWNSRCLLYLGMIRILYRGDESGIEFAKESVRLEPGDPSAVANLGNSYFALRDFDSSERWLRRALLLDPVDALVMTNLGNIFSLRKNYAEAIKWYEKSIDVDPGEASAYEALAHVYHLQKEFDRSQEFLEKARSLRTRSDLHFEFDADSFKVFDKNEVRALQLAKLAWSQVLEGDFAAAKSTFEEARTADPENLKVLWGLARVHHRRGEAALALGIYEQMLAMAKADEEYADLMPTLSMRTAECFYDLGQTTKSIEWYRDAWKSYSSEIPAAEGVAEIIEAVESAPESPERFRLTEVRVGEAAKEQYCVPKSLYAVLSHWRLPADVNALGEQLVRENGPVTQETVEYLEGRGDVEVRCFTLRPSLVKELLKGGYPVILLTMILQDAQYVAHASVITGFDDALGLFFLEDSNWLYSPERIPYGLVDGNRCLLVAPSGELESVEASLPDVEYWRSVHRGIWLLHRAGDPVAAEKSLREAIGLRDDEFLAQMFLGFALERQGRLEKAIQAAEKCVELNPRAAYVQHFLGSLTWRHGDTGRAEELFLAALSLEPRFVGARVSLAKLYTDCEDVDASLFHLDELVRQRPLNASLHFQRGRLQGLKGFEDDAVSSLALSGSLGGPPESYLRLAEIYERQLKLQPAIRALEAYRDRLDDAERVKVVERRIQRLRAAK